RATVVATAAASTPSGLRRMLSESTAMRGGLVIGAAGAPAACTSTANMPPAPAVPDPSAGYVAELTPYHIQVGDVLDIRLMLNPELNEEVPVRPDGRISTTVVPDELAYNRTVPELAAALRQDYAKD